MLRPVVEHRAALTREPEVIDEAIRNHRDMWTELYQAGLGFDVGEEPSA
jgi:hypothetical protein